MSKTNEEFIKQQRVGDLPKVKLMAPSLDGGPDREVTVVYQRTGHIFEQNSYDIVGAYVQNPT
ncbi:MULTISPECIES: hypothetical protein [unclassified Paenibacillus]|uniref:hypothetical protein n=1 Tax=unclassified Paenibacillus TaxID=185978 RepID=UPI0008C2D7AF|nr:MULTISPECIES: hypothetical protein [unclassified Paenibacillus]QLG40371.1 hypothetical protein HW560_21180 [Paenibacillus sp. E222]SEN72900.1 hypothetical protein SAMN05518670_2546 [Paenibacillus sp. OK076]